MLPNLQGDAARIAEQRLRDHEVCWLTTVTPDGRPQTSPVGYVWDGATLLIISSPDAPKVRNVRGNPRVAMHLDTATGTEEYTVLTIEGEARLDPAAPGEPAPLTESETAAYLEKHRHSMDSAGMTPHDAFTEFSTVVRVTPTRARCY